MRSNKLFRIICLTLVGCTLFLTSPLYVNGAEVDGIYTNVETASKTTSYFVPLTEQEYEQAMLENKTGTTEQKIRTFQRAKQRAAARSWDQDFSVDMGDGTYVLQGYIVSVYTKYGMTVESNLLAKKRGSNNAGYTWIEWASEGFCTVPSGAYEFYGTCQSMLLSATQLTVNTVGYFQISRSDAVSIGVEIGNLTFSHEDGGTYYYRATVRTSHIESAGVSTG